MKTNLHVTHLLNNWSFEFGVCFVLLVEVLIAYVFYIHSPLPSTWPVSAPVHYITINATLLVFRTNEQGSLWKKWPHAYVHPVLGGLVWCGSSSCRQYQPSQGAQVDKREQNLANYLVQWMLQLYLSLKVLGRRPLACEKWRSMYRLTIEWNRKNDVC